MSAADVVPCAEVPAAQPRECGGAVEAPVVVAPGRGPRGSAEPRVVDFTTAAQVVLERLQRRLSMDMWAVSRRDGDDYVVLSAVDAGGTGVRTGDVYLWDDTFCAASLDGLAPEFSTDVAAEPGWAHARQATGLKFRSYLSVPLTSPDGEVLGTLCAGSRTRVPPHVADGLEEVRAAAGVLATVLTYELRLEQQHRRVEHAEAAAESDALTELGNRRAWSTALASEEARAQRLGSTASVLVLDVDHLTVLNDSLGQAEGDALLVRTADVLRRHLRPEDFCARTGGDEFAVLLPGTGVEAAGRVVQRLQEALLRTGISASLGAATRRAALGLDAAWSEAETALSADKAARAGRQLLTARGIDRREPAEGGEAAPDASSPDVGGSPAAEQIARLLHVARRQLGLDAALVGQFDGDRWTVRHAATAPGVRLPSPSSWPAGETYCLRVLDGRLPSVIPDVAANALVADLPFTAALGIGAYVGVPVYRRDGSVYGTLCAFSAAAQPQLEPRDAGVLAVLAEALGDFVGSEELRAADRKEILGRLGELRRAGGPQPVYQPIVRLSTLEVAGHEALSRFPTGTPDVWFADAARIGASEDLELAAVEAALRRRPHTPGYLSVNVSPGVASSPALARLMADQPLDTLVLEITEHERVQDYGALLRNLHPLRAAGLRLAVDDAGAGFASLHHVLALQPEFIKLDMSLIRDIHRDPPRRALAAALTVFAQQSGSCVIAEGIETVEELRCLQGLGVSHGQGYYLGRPAPSTVLVP